MTAILAAPPAPSATRSSTPGYIVMSDAGAMRLGRAEHQAKRYGMVLWWGAAATVFRSRQLAEKAVARTVAYRAEFLGTRPSRDRRQYWIVRLGPRWDGRLPPVRPPRRRGKRTRKARP